MNATRARRIGRVLLWVALIAACAAVWLAYQRPVFAIWLNGAMWLCAS